MSKFTGRGDVAVGTSDSHRDNLGSNLFAGVSKLGQFRLLHVASVQSTVLMNTWP